MATPPPTMRLHADPDPELLLAHSAWIRALARKMAGAEAEDLVQDTWLAALERPRAEVRSLRSWLGGLVSNLAREKRRGEARRRVREERAGGGASSAPSVAETVEAAATGRELADLVLALEEPFRSVVLLRYYEDLPPRRIARVLGVPVRTVNSRLTRGLERLRERWKQRERAAGREEGGWMRSLLFLAGARPALTVPAATYASGAALSLGVVLMNAKIWLGAAVVGAGAMAWWLSTPRAAHPRATGADVAALPRPLAELAPVPEQAGAPPVTREERRTAVATPGAAAFTSEPARPGGALRTLRGRVLDTDALPLAGVEVVLADWGSDTSSKGRPKALSGQNGVFELALPPEESGMLRASDDDYVTVMSGRVDGRSAVEPLVVVARRIELAGAVVDEGGAPLSEVRVSFQHPPGFRARFEAVLDTTDAGEWRSVTDASGRFELVPVPSIDGAELVAELEGFATWRGALPWRSERGLVLTLVRAAPEAATVSGVVLEPGGRPAAGAWVSLGARSTATDSAGEFRLERGDAPDGTELRALKAGHRLARFAAEVGLDGKPTWPDYVVLELGGPPLELAGHVLDAHGAPRTDVRVWIADATPFGVMADDVLASAEYFLAGTDGGYFHSCATDAEGGFRLAGLLERDYSVNVMSRRTLACRTFGPFHAGDDALALVFDEGPLGRIEGRVVARDGRGLAGVSVSLMGNGFGGIWWSAGTAVSDDDGRFTFAHVGGARMQLGASADGIVPLWSPVEPPDGKTIEVELLVAVRCHFKVDLGAAADRADALRVLDGEENPLVAYRIDPNGTLTMDEFPIVAGRSDSLGVDERAATLVLLKAGAEVARVPLALRPGILNLVTP